MKDKAFELIFREYNRMVTAYLYSLVGDAHEALDLTQEVFVVAYRKLREFDPDHSIAAWLRSIAWNLAANALRSSRRRRLMPLASGQLDHAFVLFDGPESDRAWEDRLEALDRCLERLPDGQQKAVNLFYRAGASCREIARTLGVVENTVFQWMWQARKNLKKCIELGSAR